MGDCVSLEIRMKLGAASPLHTVRRPRTAPLPERNVIGWVPVLGGYYEREPGHQSIDDRDDLVALVDGKRAARTEIILDIDKDQRGVLELRSHLNALRSSL